MHTKFLLDIHQAKDRSRAYHNKINSLLAMIKAVLIDDEQHCIDTMTMLLDNYCPQVKVVSAVQSGQEGLAAIAKYNPDVVFLDIEMPVMNGFEMLEHFPSIPFAVVFATSYDQYALKAIRFSALDYLLKPIDAKELISAVHKIESTKNPPLPEQYRMLFSQVRNRGEGFSRIAVPTLEGFDFVPYEQLISCEADDNYTHLHLTPKGKITACRTLKEMEELLQEFPSFVRVHHSWIVNLNEVKKYIRGEGGYLIMNDGSTINVSRSRKDLLLKKLVPGKD